MDDDREIVQLMEKIQYAKNVYDQASDSIHSSVMKSELRNIKASRESMFREIEEHTGSRPVKNGQPPLYEKFWVMLNDLLIQKNTPYILQSCIKADRAVIDAFEELIQGGALDERSVERQTVDLLKAQYEKVTEQVRHFEQEIEQYPWS
jgi:hypothetical protein